ncbi:MAG: DNA mismatch repair protein MutS [bacterium]
MAKKTTPLLEQYNEIKEKYQDELLFFRLGDFYELFYEDARVASRVMEITLTSKPVGKGNKIPMAGVPAHSVNSYIEKVINSGYRVAICEQVEEASQASGVVNREVIRVITPGTLTEEDYLDSRQNNYLLSFFLPDKSTKVGLAYLDLSTGEFEVTEFEDDFENTVLISEICRLHPAEILISDCQKYEPIIATLSTYYDNIAITRRPGWQFEPEEAKISLNKQFKKLPEEIVASPLLISPSGALVHYLGDTQKQNLSHINKISRYDRKKFMVLDAASQRNLELVESLTSQQHATLLNVLDATETAMGSRRLRRWILQPLLNDKKINSRLNAVEWFVNNGPEIPVVKEQLRQIFDIQRIVGKIGSNRANPRDIKALGESLKQIPAIKELLPDTDEYNLMKNRLHELSELREEIEAAIVDNPPAKISEGEIFKSNYNERLDELRDLMRGGRDWITNLQKEERERTGINSLKVGHNRVYGYYIEVTDANLDSVPDDYQRKQTLANSERYITPELKEKERMIFGAEDKAMALEEELFIKLREDILQYLEKLQENADVLADLDVIVCLAELARQRGYSRPKVDWSSELKIEKGRHPVVEEIHEEEFVPNDLELDRERRLVILTGPNMAGKSTYIRQVALISIMAQMGSFVPADFARVGMIDRVFTRVGAHDFLAGGQSTFMVEMIETAEIINNAAERSLLILDEVGRGTSTYDGVAIAWSVVEYIARRINARTLFATHYHELNELADRFNNVFNMTVRAREWDDEIVFLRQVVEGHSDHSYGIQVGKLAGLPEGVIERSRQVLHELEEEKTRKIPEASGEREIAQLDLFHPARQVLDKLEELEVEKMTPLEALNALNRLQQDYKKAEQESS